MSENKKLHQAWLSVLGVFTSAEHRLMESLGLNPDNPLGVELLQRVKKNREDFERRVDEGVKAAVAKVRAPIEKELQTLKGRIEQISQRIDKKKSKE
jgi:hypothetical protein